VGTRRAITPDHGRVVSLACESRIYVFGAALLIALTICSRTFGDRGGSHFMASMTIAGVAYLLAVREVFRGWGARATQVFPRRAVLVGLVLAAVWHIEFLRLPAGADDDIHRYVWDGRLQRLGYNPYIVVPSDPAVATLHTQETRTLNNRDLTSLYPPGAELFFRAVTAVHESTFALKVAFVICDFAIALVLLDVLRKNGGRAHLVLVFAWNPLLAIEVAGSGHIDIVGGLLLLISVAALVRKWQTIAALAFGLAVAVKFLPIVLLPLYWKRIRIRDAAIAAAAVALLYVPFLDHGRIPWGSLGTYVTGFRFNGPLFAILHHVMPSQLLAELALLAGLATATWMRRQSLTTEGTELRRRNATELSLGESMSIEAFAWPMAASLLCAPVVFPWYLLWLLPFLTSASTWLIIVWTVSIIPTYLMWHLSRVSGTWGTLPVWVMVVEYGCLAVAAAIIIFRRCRSATVANPNEV
jgi:Glycosyltransferase family 87